MAALEEKVVLQSDVSRIVDRVLGEVRKAGPQVFGQAVAGPAAIGEVRKEMRRLESKVAGLEARILGIAEDSTAEGRVWRASLCAKAAGPVARSADPRESREEATRAELQEHFQQSCEAAELAAQRAQRLASEAADRAREVASEVMASMEEPSTRPTEFEPRLESDLKRGKERSTQAEQEMSQLSNRLATMRVDVATQKERGQAQEEKLLEREAAHLDAARQLQQLRRDLEAQGEIMRATLEALIWRARARAPTRGEAMSPPVATHRRCVW
eukprot:g20963.t1